MSSEDDPLDPRRLGKTEPLSGMARGFVSPPQHAEERAYRMRDHRIIHDEDCDYANQIVGKENRLGWVVDARGINPARQSVCQCGANPDLAKPVVLDERNL